MKMLWLRLSLIPARRVWAMFGLALLLGPLGFALGLWFLDRPPVALIALDENDGLAKIGGDIDLRATKHTNAICRTKVARWLWHWNPEDPRPDPSRSDPEAFAKKNTIWREITSAPDSPPVFSVNATYDIMIPIRESDHIEPGKWFYLGEATDDCTSKPRFSLPIAPILIEAATHEIRVPEVGK